MSTPSAPPTGTGTGTGTASSAASTVPKPPPTSSAPSSSSSSGQPPPSSSTSDTAAAASNSNGNKQVQVQVQVQEEEKKMDDTEDNNNNNDDDGKEDSNSSNNSSSNIPVTAVAMKLLDIKLKPSSAIIKSIIGEFTSDAIKLKIQQIIIARSGGVLELYNISSSSSSTGGNGNATTATTTTTTTPSLKLIKRLETRSILRDITTIRLVGEKRDVLACSSDSGCLSIIDFNIISTSGGQGGGGGSDNNNIESAIVTTSYGKSGCRRSTPGQYLACDPKGRAICVSAIEKRKLVYVLNHNQEGGGSASKSNKIALASPLEAHRTRTLCLATVGVDNGYDNPMFACIEIQYSELDDGSEDNGDGNSNNNNNNKQLAYYELDLGLNHVSRKWAISIPYSSYSLEALPGYSDGGPSGVLVGSENEITWYHNSSSVAEVGVKCTLPKRVWDSNPSKNINTLVTQLVIHRQKRNKFFGLCQTEIGDTFKIDFDLTKAGEGGGSGDDSAMDTTTSGSNDPCVKSITIALLDTLPLANSLNISKKGLLFLASEFGGYYDHGLYQFERIDLPNSPTMKTSIASSITSSSSSGGSEETSTATATATAIVTTYTPSSKLQNLILIDKLDNLSPTIDVLVGELTGGQETAPQIYTIGGKGPSACLKTLRHGCSVTELAISELPGIPGQIFTVNNIPEEISGGTAEEDSNNNNYSKYIVVSFADATLVLSVGDTVEEVGRESGTFIYI
jgi:splicing factor 3B subunit 3